MKKWFMRQYWRIQQSQTLISMGFWASTLTLLIWPYVSWRFEAESTMAGIKMTYWGLFGIGASVILIVLLIGRVYDATLGLWREHLTIVQERTHSPPTNSMHLLGYSLPRLTPSSDEWLLKTRRSNVTVISSSAGWCGTPSRRSGHGRCPP